jgi:hypothetical protein
MEEGREDAVVVVVVVVARYVVQCRSSLVVQQPPHQDQYPSRMDSRAGKRSKKKEELEEKDTAPLLALLLEADLSLPQSPTQMTGERLRALMRLLHDVDSMPWLNSTDLRSHYVVLPLAQNYPIDFDCVTSSLLCCRTTSQLPFVRDWFNKA